MTLRRCLLATGLAGLVASAARPTRAAPGSVELEADGYAGTSTGGWICGPVSRAHYAGGAGEVRYRGRPMDDPESTAFVADGAASVEHERQELLGCGDPATPCDAPRLPPARTLVAGRARAGVDFGGVALEGGPLVAQWWAAADDASPATRIRPDLDVRIGRAHEGARGHVGFGAPVVTQIRRPGLYGGLGFERNGWALDAYPSLSRSGPSGDDFAFRFDAALTAPITRSLGVRGGGSLGFPGEHPTDAALTAGVAATF
jgi:hypothetical protein